MTTPLLTFSRPTYSPLSGAPTWRKVSDMQAVGALFLSGGVLALLYAAATAVYGRKAIGLYAGPISIGVGVALICGSVAILLMRTPTLASLAATTVAVIAGNYAWWRGERHWRRTKKKVLPLARAIEAAKRRTRDQQDSA
jgi:hypothetical protein